LFPVTSSELDSATKITLSPQKMQKMAEGETCGLSVDMFGRDWNPLKKSLLQMK